MTVLPCLSGVLLNWSCLSGVVTSWCCLSPGYMYSGYTVTVGQSECDTCMLLSYMCIHCRNIPVLSR